MAPMDPSSGSTVAYGGKAADAYRKALSTAASAAAYAVLARSMARELLPDELRAAARWGASVFRARLGWAGAKERRTLVVRSQTGGGSGSEENLLFDAARTYLSSRLDPRDMRRLGLTLCKSRDDTGRRSWRKRLFMEPDDSTTDVFDGVQFTWTSVEKSNGSGGEKKKASAGESGTGGDREFMLMLSFDAEHTDMAMERYVPFVMTAAEETERRERSLKICLNEGRSWFGLNHHHPATFDTLAMDPTLKQSIVADLDLFANRRDHYRRIGKAWKRGYLLYGPPGTGKSSLVAAMANHLRYNIYDLDLSHVESTMLQWLLITMSDKSILVIEDIDCCCDAMSRAVDGKENKTPALVGDKDGGVSSDIMEIPPPRARNTEVIDSERFHPIPLSINTFHNFLNADMSMSVCAPGTSDYPIQSAQLHRRAVVDERRGAHHRPHHQLQGTPGPGAAAAGAHGHAHLHGLLLLGGVQDARPELLPRRRPPPVPGDTGTACGGAGDAGRGIRDAAEDQ
jgi:chaperone BCS1